MQTIRYEVAGIKREIRGRIIRERSASISILPKGRPAWATEIVFKCYITEIV